MLLGAAVGVCVWFVALLGAAVAPWVRVQGLAGVAPVCVGVWFVVGRVPVVVLGWCCRSLAVAAWLSVVSPFASVGEVVQHELLLAYAFLHRSVEVLGR